MPSHSSGEGIVSFLMTLEIKGSGQPWACKALVT